MFLACRPVILATLPYYGKNTCIEDFPGSPTTGHKNKRVIMLLYDRQVDGWYKITCYSIPFDLPCRIHVDGSTSILYHVLPRDLVIFYFSVLYRCHWCHHFRTWGWVHNDRYKLTNIVYSSQPMIIEDDHSTVICTLYFSIRLWSLTMQTLSILGVKSNEDLYCHAYPWLLITNVNHDSALNHRKIGWIFIIAHSHVFFPTY